MARVDSSEIYKDIFGLRNNLNTNHIGKIRSSALMLFLEPKC